MDGNPLTHLPLSVRTGGVAEVMAFLRTPLNFFEIDEASLATVVPRIRAMVKGRGGVGFGLTLGVLRDKTDPDWTPPGDGSGNAEAVRAEHAGHGSDPPAGDGGPSSSTTAESSESDSKATSDETSDGEDGDANVGGGSGKTAAPSSPNLIITPPTPSGIFVHPEALDFPSKEPTKPPPLTAKATVAPAKTLPNANKDDNNDVEDGDQVRENDRTVAGLDDSLALAREVARGEHEARQRARRQRGKVKPPRYISDKPPPTAEEAVDNVRLERPRGRARDRRVVAAPTTAPTSSSSSSASSSSCDTDELLSTTRESSAGVRRRTERSWSASTIAR